MIRNGAGTPPGLPLLMAVQPQLPEGLQLAAVPTSKEMVLQAIAQGFVSAVASSVRAEILGAELEIEVSLDTTVRRIEIGTRLLVGLFVQTHPGAVSLGTASTAARSPGTTFAHPAR